MCVEFGGLFVQCTKKCIFRIRMRFCITVEGRVRIVLTNQKKCFFPHFQHTANGLWSFFSVAFDPYSWHKIYVFHNLIREHKIICKMIHGLCAHEKLSYRLVNLFILMFTHTGTHTHAWTPEPYIYVFNKRLWCETCDVRNDKKNSSSGKADFFSTYIVGWITKQ